MTHIDVYKHFEMLFPEKAEKGIKYFPNGKNSIRVRNVNKPEMIFTFKSPLDWKLETIDSFLNSNERL